MDTTKEGPRRLGCDGGNSRPDAPRPDPAERAVGWALATLGLTSLHHAYGAWIYGTPWRLDAVYVSGASALLILAGFALHRTRLSRADGVRGMAGAIGHLLLGLVILSVPVLAIGGFEGAWNHAMKNVLYFGGASGSTLTGLFPPPRYEMPNDILFEITGILQLVPAVLAGLYLYRMRWPRRLNPPESPAAREARSGARRRPLRTG